MTLTGPFDPVSPLQNLYGWKMPIHSWVHCGKYRDDPTWDPVSEATFQPENPMRKWAWGSPWRRCEFDE